MYFQTGGEKWFLKHEIFIVDGGKTNPDCIKIKF